MKQGTRKIEETPKDNDMDKDQGFFLPRQNKEEPAKEIKRVEGAEGKKDNLSDLFFLSDYPWKDE